MKRILRIDSSLFADQAVSHQLADELVASLLAQFPQSNVVTRDVAQDDTPHLDGQWIKALTTPDEVRDDVQRQKVAYSDVLIAEVLQADVLIVGAPMYNFSVPSVLKAWFDHIARAGVTFAYTSEGPKGLLENKTVYVITTRGGIHKDKPSDTQVPFMKNFFGFIGINDVRVIYAEGLNMGDGARDKGLAIARTLMQQAVAA